jgi:hypothetical protein
MVAQLCISSLVWSAHRLNSSAPTCNLDAIQVVGMTTTGVAMHQQLITALAPKVCCADIQFWNSHVRLMLSVQSHWPYT